MESIELDNSNRNIQNDKNENIQCDLKNKSNNVQKEKNIHSDLNNILTTLEIDNVNDTLK